jgi:uncharacterized membrane protein YwaF
MMTIGGVAHILMILASIAIGIILFFVVRNSSERVQNNIIYTLMGVCVFGIFFLHGTRYFTTFDLKNLLVQMLQVCNFNLILIPLCLFKRNELARQYLFLFSMPMALSTFVAYPGDVEGSMWYSIVCLTFWINHFLIALIPILMVATGRFKPRKDYVYKVIICVFIYFAIAFIGNYVLNGFVIHGDHNHSYTMEGDGIMLLMPLYRLIPIPFVYLLPIIPVLLVVYFGVAKLFEKYKTSGSIGFKIGKRRENV